MTETFYKLEGIPTEDSKNAFDKDIELFSGTRFTKITFDDPVKIDVIRISPRIANNHIVNGDKYILQFFENGSWTSSNTTFAEYNYLIFGNIPSNSLYLLRDISIGKEELSFTFENSKQVWRR